MNNLSNASLVVPDKPASKTGNEYHSNSFSNFLWNEILGNPVKYKTKIKTTIFCIRFDKKT